MNIWEILKLSFSNLMLNKFRSFLTMLGIIMGISSVILISSLGKGFENKILGDIQTFATKNVSITITSQNIERSEYISKDDIKNIKNLDARIEDVYLSMDIGEYDEIEQFYTFVGGMTDKGIKALNSKIIAGRDFTKEEYNDKYIDLILVDENTAKKKVGKDYTKIIGKKVKVNVNHLNKKEYTVIGVFTNPNQELSNLFSLNSEAYILPYKSVNFLDNGLYTNINLSVKDTKNIKELTNKVEHYLNKKTNKKNIYKVEPLSKQLEQVNKILLTVSIMISLIASISLVVGGIGVMNIMLVSVTERITEIGLRKALGAKNKDIKKQFLLESSFLTLVGGMIGIIIGYVLALIISIPLKITPILTLKVLIISVIVSIVTGIFFGMYPAKKASKLSPMEALRKE